MQGPHKRQEIEYPTAGSAASSPGRVTWPVEAKQSALHSCSSASQRTRSTREDRSLAAKASCPKQTMSRLPGVLILTTITSMNSDRML